MNIKKTFLTIFLSTAGALSLNAQEKTITYRYETTLCFLKHGIDSFLDMIKKESKNACPELYLDTLWDIEECASKNKTNFPRLLKRLQNTLSKRIQRIDSVQNKNIYLNDIFLGMGYTGLTAALIYGIHYVYSNYYTAKENEIKEVIKSFEDDGIFVKYDATHKTIHFSVQPEDPRININDMNRLIALYESKNNFGTLCFSGCLITILPLYYSFLYFSQGLKPHYDDEFREKYESLLIITKQIIKESKFTL